jgi:hypothetical protein
VPPDSGEASRPSPAQASARPARRFHDGRADQLGQLVVTTPALGAHLLGQLLAAFGPDRVLWGTDSIWYGTPQWQIAAFRRLEIPGELVDAFEYPPLTREVKAKIFGLSAAALFGVDPEAKRSEVPKDFVSKIKMAYLEEEPRPSHRLYGWVAG